MGFGSKLIGSAFAEPPENLRIGISAASEAPPPALLGAAGSINPASNGFSGADDPETAFSAVKNAAMKAPSASLSFATGTDKTRPSDLRSLTVVASASTRLASS